MSKKKYRKAAGAQPGDNGTSTHSSRTRESIRKDVLNNATAEQLRRHVEAGWTAFRALHATCDGPTEGDGPLTDAEVKGMLASCARFLHQVVYLTGGVMRTVDAWELRKIVGKDMKLPDQVRLHLEAAGIDLSELEQEPAREPANEHPQREDPRKRPRGRKHPLLVLFSLAVQASRLFDRITAKTNPHAHNLMTLAEREDEKIYRELKRGL